MIDQHLDCSKQINAARGLNTVQNYRFVFCARTERGAVRTAFVEEKSDCNSKTTDISGGQLLGNNEHEKLEKIIFMSK